MDKLKKKGGKHGKAFSLFHCYDILEKEEKWKNRSFNEIPNKRKTPSVGEGLVVDTDDEGSSSPTHVPSVTRKRPDGRKKAEDARAKGGDNVYKESLDNMMAVRKELATQRRELRHKELEERREAEERRVAAKERLAEIEERKVANDEIVKRVEHEHKLMFMDPKGLDEKAQAYLELMRDQILLSGEYGGGNGGYGGGNGGDNGGYGGGGYGGGEYGGDGTI